MFGDYKVSDGELARTASGQYEAAEERVRNLERRIAQQRAVIEGPGSAVLPRIEAEKARREVEKQGAEAELRSLEARLKDARLEAAERKAAAEEAAQRAAK
jgi:Skp family chaperone for outer membrane proteins